MEMIDMPSLLGRKTFHGEHVANATTMTGCRVLITGGCGFIGTACARALAVAEKVVLLDSCEAAVARAIGGCGLPDNVEMVVGNINSPRFGRALREHAIDAVIHCAAMKHVDICEANPHAAFETNVLGTLNVAKACTEVGIPMVMVSTDKATTPKGVMGATKRLAEAITRDHRGSVVRLANVLGSDGSVITRWMMAYMHGKAAIVTNPESTRYYMVADEAAWSIVEALDWAERRSVTFVFNAGEPISTGELKERWSKDYPTHVSGMRPGEVVHEALCVKEENPVARVNTDNGRPLLWELTCLDDHCIGSLYGLMAAHDDREPAELFTAGLMRAMVRVDLEKRGV